MKSWIVPHLMKQPHSRRFHGVSEPQSTHFHCGIVRACVCQAACWGNVLFWTSGKKTGCFKNDSGISNNCMILQPVWVVWFLRILGGGWRLAFGPCACSRRGASTGLQWIWQTCGGFIPQWSPSCRCPFDALVGQSGGFHKSIWWSKSPRFEMNAVECSLWSVVYLVTGDSCEAFELWAIRWCGSVPSFPYSICGTMHLRHAGSPHYCATNNGSCSAFVVGTAGG